MKEIERRDKELFGREESFQQGEEIALPFENTSYVTTKIMAETTGMAESTTRRYLNKFCDWAIIKSDGKNRGTKYYLL